MTSKEDLRKTILGQIEDGYLDLSSSAGYDNEFEYIKQLISEHEKLKQVIDILKDKIEFEDLGEMQSGNVYRGYFNDCFDEEEVKSIKEVLDNE